jgi:hypothetical protein
MVAAGPGKPVVGQGGAMNGKLLEIDLGEEARQRNIAMTERARRRLAGEAVEDDDEDGATPDGGKARLGKDGKLLRTRNRRNSDDIRRDQLVEEFLRENKRKSSLLSLLSALPPACLPACQSTRIKHVSLLT